MADIRIKDLTTTASTTAADDFFAADGATNGTRKLSAYSPTFGGNATVGGTLTVSGSSVGIGTAVDAAVGINSRPTITTGSFQYGLYSTPTVNASTSDSGFFSMITAASSAVGSAFLLRAFTPTLGSSSTITNAFGLRIENIGATGVTNAWGIDIAAQSGGSGSNVGLRNAGTTLLTNTTASTTTSSGALVVGNGTSGGLGVGGNIYAGGNLALTGTGALIATSSADSMARIGFGLFSLEQGVAIGLSRRLNYGDALIGRNLQGQSGSDSYITSATTPSSGYGAFEIQHGGVARILLGSGATTANAVVTPTVAASFTTTTAAVSTVLQVINATASSAYNNGALVVSGGVGIDGAVNATGIVGTTAAAQRITNTSGAFQIYKDGTPSKAARFSFNTAATDTVSLGVYDGSSWTDTFRVTTTQALVTTSTASTGTSSGALVVSGGVGVAGAIYAGARIQSAADLVVDAGSGSANAALYLAGRNSGTQNLVTIQSNFEGALTITPKAGQGTTIASSLTTAAPSGGTAAAWKLGTVATVSPTSPNRTIEVDIGGTIYYIHAKTTNN